MTKIFRYEVTGRGAFPFDMLRYDSAWLHDGDNPDRDRRAPDYYERRTIRLKSMFAPTIDRWNSFGWLVENVST